MDNGEVWEVVATFGNAYLWNPEKVQLLGELGASEATIYTFTEKEIQSDKDYYHCKEWFSRAAVLPTSHTYGYVGFFKPSLDEVLSQLPDELFDGRFTKFYITTDTIKDDVQVITYGDYHVGRTKIYLPSRGYFHYLKDIDWSAHQEAIKVHQRILKI